VGSVEDEWTTGVEVGAAVMRKRLAAFSIIVASCALHGMLRRGLRPDVAIGPAAPPDGRWAADLHTDVCELGIVRDLRADPRAAVSN